MIYPNSSTFTFTLTVTDRRVITECKCFKEIVSESGFDFKKILKI